MDGQPVAAEPKHSHQASPWSRSSSSSGTPRARSASTSLPDSSPTHFPNHLDLLPILFPQQSSLYQAQLLHYNTLIAPGRGGGGGLQSPVHYPALSSPQPPNKARSRSSSKVSDRENSSGRPGAQNCHGNRQAKRFDNADRAIITPAKDMPPKMSVKKSAESSNGPHQPLPPRPPAYTAHSSSVPSTPRQHARKFSFESREPSPSGPQNHSPRSAYSETNSTLPSLRPLPPRNGGCRFETASFSSRRRMNYSLGSDRLEKVPLDKVKSKLSEEEERKLSTDMRELYDRLLPTTEVEQNRKRLVQKLEKLFNNEWPGHDIRVNLFGSSGNLLCSDDSDVDICITTEWKDLEAVCMIAALLHKHGMEKVVCVSSARVPIVKIWDPELKLACDMNVNNPLALENTRMVRTYVQIDERVRPLAMIIKYWTKKRIVNDAAFGATLSSYTWICMIIAFLQLRDPEILPALHQEQQKTKKNGGKSEFADDVQRLQGFGDRNESSLGALLFQFFRFYAHEFDYDKFALSVRLGKMITKKEKGWHLQMNNLLCVEEPFNISRNLGNTADDTSFRGLHIELRRAFDLIAEGKLDECCEQYVFPKEEEKIWQKPAPTPRPILVRSSSQQHANRGGRGGFRGNGRQFHRNGGNNRRASSSIAYDTNAQFAQPVLPQALTPQEAQFLWWQAQHPQLALPQDMFGSALNALQAQENNLRFQLYTQQQAIQQQHALAQAHRMQQSQSQSSDRSRTNSFDNPPLSAPLRPELAYLYPYAFPQPYFAHPGFPTFPPSPSTTASGGATEFRRSLHRSTAASESGVSTGSGTPRSQSQPASRSSIPTSHTAPGYPTSASGYPTSAQPSSTSSMFPPRQVNGVTIPSFIPDESNDWDYDDSVSKAVADTPPEDDGPRYVGYYVSETSSPNRNVHGMTSGIPTFGDLGQSATQGRRRLSTDQLPQSILERRTRRISRSPSPPHHTRAFSVGTKPAPLAPAPFAQAASNPIQERGPLVVNGTASKLSNATNTSHQATATDPMAAESYDNPLRIHQITGPAGPWVDQTIVQSPAGAEPSPPLNDRPVVVNGSTSTQSPQASQNLHIFPNVLPINVQHIPDPQSFGQRMAMMGVGMQMPPHSAVVGDVTNGLPRVATSGRSRIGSRQQQNGLAPLDLATSDFSMPLGFQHLSPVYEHRSASPTLLRKLEQPQKTDKAAVASSSKVTLTSAKDSRADLAAQPVHTTPPMGIGFQNENSVSSPPTGVATNSPNSSATNGHSRGPSKGNADHGGGWQKPKSRKKGGAADLKGAAGPSSGMNGFGSSVETTPKNDADRKGG